MTIVAYFFGPPCILQLRKSLGCGKGYVAK